jgi:tRNA U34 5-methylaminomethyl-2-thiouridine-forming methyltransferase MnmC
LAHSLFEIVTTTTGAISIRNKAVNEIMHNPVGPWLEANLLYIDQANLRSRLSMGSGEFVIFDVGLGAAANALAAIACAHSLRADARPLRLISFERDLELLRFALANASEFAHFKGYEFAIEQILTQGQWSDGKIFWELREGDFLEKISGEKYKAHLVFFDPYSPNVNQEMWTTACFKKLRALCHEESEGGAALYTYSQATRIRAALIAAGFFVGLGSATGLKKETTEAATTLVLLKSPLSPAWYERWQRSDVRYPSDCQQPEDQAAFAKAIEHYFLNGIGPK